MKLLLLLVVLMIFALPTQASRREKRQSGCLEYVNNLRREVAEWYGVTNMNKLKYDQDMEIRFSNGLPMCPRKEDLRSGKTFEMVRLEKNEKEHMKFITMPSTTKLACIEARCPKNGKKGEEEEDVTIVVIDKQPDENEKEKKEMDGSNCDSGEADGGLCVVKEGMKKRKGRSYFSFWYS